MILQKCPRCELNYILDGGTLCSVCHEDVHGHTRDDDRASLCSVCGERVSLRGQEMCAACMAELHNLEMDLTVTDDELKPASRAVLEGDALSSLDELSEMDDEDENSNDDLDADEAIAT